MKKLTALILCLAMVLSFVVSASAESYKADIVIGTTQAPEQMDCQEMSKTTDYMAHRLTHDTLFRINEETGELIPWLCESWEIDGEKWTIRLRKDVKFSDGTPLTAADVAFTFERGKESSQIGSYCKKIDTINVVDDYTIELSWVTVNVDMGALFTNPKYSILSKAACEADPANGFKIGTGAFKLKELFDNSYAIFDRNEFYWGEAVPSQTIEFRYIAEASARLIALQNSEIDMCISPATTELDYIREDDSLALIEGAGATTIYLALNMNKTPFDNIEFRKAVAMAINKDDMIWIVLDGLGSEAKSTIGPNNVVNCDDALTGWEYNPEEAQKIIDANGWSGMTLKIYCQDSGNNKKCAEVVQAQLAEVGINVEIEALGSAELKAAAKAGEHDIYCASISVSDYADAVRTQLYTGAGYNYSFFSDAEVDAMIDEGVTMTDFAARKELYTKIQAKVFDENLYLFPMIRSNATVATVKGFDGFFCRSDLILDLTRAYVAE